MKRDLLLLVLLYAVANGLMLLNGGLFVDDWCVVGVSDQGVMTQFVGNGNPLMGHLHIALKDVAGAPYLYHAIAFGAGLIGMFLYRWCLQWFKLPSAWVFGITALYAASPLFAAKVYVIDLPYNLGLLAMLVSAVLLLRYVEKRTLGARLWALIGVAFSCLMLMTNLPMVAALIFVCALYAVRPTAWSGANVKKVVLELLGWWDFILLLLLLIVVRSLFMAPQGLYVDQYAITLLSLVKLPYSLLHLLYTTVVGFFAQTNTMIETLQFWFAIGCGVGLWLIWPKAKKQALCSNETPPTPTSFFAILLLLFLGGVVAFALLRNGEAQVDYGGFFSRYQYLMLLSVPAMLYGLVLLFKSEAIQRSALILLVSVSLLISFSTQFNYLRHWFKTIAIERYIARNPLLSADSTNVYIDNMATPYSPTSSYISPVYEWAGIARKALHGNQTHFYMENSRFYDQMALHRQLFDYYKSGDHLNMAHISSLDFDYHLVIEINPEAPFKLRTTLTTLIQRYTNRAAFEQKIDEMLLYRLSPYEPLDADPQ